MTRWWVAVVLLAGCATVPQHERSLRPVSSYSVAGLRGGKAVLREYELATADRERIKDLCELVVAALPAANGKAGTAAVVRSGSKLRVFDSDEGHAIAERLLMTCGLARDRVVKMSFASFEVPLDVAESLGPIEIARGCGDASPFFASVVTPEGLARVRRLVEEADAQGSGSTLAVRPGSWTELREDVDHVLLSDVAAVTSGWSSVAAPVTEIARTGSRVRVACVPWLEDGRCLVAYSVDDLAPAEPFHVTSSIHGERLPLELRAVVRRRAEDAVLLPAGSSVALISPGSEENTARLLVLTPSAR